MIFFIRRHKIIRIFPKLYMTALKFFIKGQHILINQKNVFEMEELAIGYRITIKQISLEVYFFQRLYANFLIH